MSRLKKCNPTVQSCTSERVGCPSLGHAGKGATGATRFTALDGAQHSQEKRQYVGRGVAGLNILWIFVRVRKDEHLQRLVELCIPEGFGQLLKYKWTFRSVFRELKTSSMKCRYHDAPRALFVYYCCGIYGSLFMGKDSPLCVAHYCSELPTGCANPEGGCCTHQWAGRKPPKPFLCMGRIVRRTAMHISMGGSSVLLTHSTVSFSNHLSLLWDFSL